MDSGQVKWFDAKKGFGFILNPEGKDVFVHFSSIEGDGFRSLKDGEGVEYEQFTGDKGLSARKVRRASVANAAPVKVKVPRGSCWKKSLNCCLRRSPPMVMLCRPR